MKNFVIVFSAAVLQIGCVAPQQTVDQEISTPKEESDIKPQEDQEPDLPTLYRLTDAREILRPEKYCSYKNDSRKIKIFQVVFDHDGQDGDHYVLAQGKDFIIAVISDRDYVEDEFLVPGEYCYCGPYQYSTAPVYQGVQSKGTKTVRMFVEVTNDDVRSQMKTLRRELIDGSAKKDGSAK